MISIVKENELKLHKKERNQKYLNGGPWWGGNVLLRRSSRALFSDSVSLSKITITKVKFIYANSYILIYTHTI